MLQKIIFYLTCLLLFLLPWQTRWMYHQVQLNGGYWEYGSESMYGTEILLWVIIILSFVFLLRQKEVRARLVSRENFRQRKWILFACSSVFLFFVLQILFSTSPRISLEWVVHGVEAMCLGVVVVGMVGSFPPLPREGGEGLPSSLHACESGEFTTAQKTATPSVLPLGKGEKRTALTIFVSFWLGGVMQGVLALYQFFTQQVDANKWFGLAFHSAKQLGDYVLEVGDERWLRAYGSFGSPNILGGYLAICLLVGLVLYAHVVRIEKYRAALWITVGNLSILSGLIVSFSRSAWLAVAVGVVSLFVIARSVATWQSPGFQNEPGTQKRGFLVGLEASLGMTSLKKQLIFSLPVILIFIVALAPLFHARALGEGRLETKSITERTAQYTEAFNLFKQHPLWGTGPGTYTLALYKNDPTRKVWNYQPVHNVFVLALVETGVIGFVGLLLLNCYIVKLLWRQNRILLPILISILVLGLFDHYLWSLYGGMLLVGAVIGLGCGEIKNQMSPLAPRVETKAMDI